MPLVCYVQEFVQDVHEQCIRRDVQQMIENLKEQHRWQRHQKQDMQTQQQQKQDTQTQQQQTVSTRPVNVISHVAQWPPGGAEAAMSSAGNTSLADVAGGEARPMDID